MQILVYLIFDRKKTTTASDTASSSTSPVTAKLNLQDKSPCHIAVYFKTQLLNVNISKV